MTRSWTGGMLVMLSRKSIQQKPPGPAFGKPCLGRTRLESPSVMSLHSLGSAMAGGVRSWQVRGGRTMSTLDGTLSLSGLPPHRGLILKLCFYSVPSADAPAPYAGNPPAEAATDCHEFYNQVDLHTELTQSAYELPFHIERPPGYYYLQVRAILFRNQGGKVFAHAEQFFYSRRPVAIPQAVEGHLTLPVSWPTESLDELHHHGTVHPRPSGGA